MKPSKTNNNRLEINLFNIRLLKGFTFNPNNRINLSKTLRNINNIHIVTSRENSRKITHQETAEKTILNNKSNMREISKINHQSEMSNKKIQMKVKHITKENKVDAMINNDFLTISYIIIIVDL